MEQVLWPTSVELNAEDELLVLTFSDFLPLGEAILGMEFQGTLNDQMRGFYRRFAFKMNNFHIPVNWKHQYLFYVYLVCHLGFNCFLYHSKVCCIYITYIA